jgi:hypothetical protein
VGRGKEGRGDNRPDNTIFNPTIKKHCSFLLELSFTKDERWKLQRIKIQQKRQKHILLLLLHMKISIRSYVSRMHSMNMIWGNVLYVFVWAVHCFLYLKYNELG